VDKINQDFPKGEDDNWKAYFPFLDDKNEFHVESTDYPMPIKIHTVSRKGCEVLIRDNKGLLRQAYGK